MPRAARPRRLVVDGIGYRWSTRHQHTPDDGATRDRGPFEHCRERFSAWQDGARAAPVRILFASSGARNAGYPESGVVWIAGPPTPPGVPSPPRLSLNLNTPAVAVLLVRLALGRGWDPGSGCPCEFDGFALIDGHPDEHLPEPWKHLPRPR